MTALTRTTVGYRQQVENNNSVKQQVQTMQKERDMLSFLITSYQVLFYVLLTFTVVGAVLHFVQNIPYFGFIISAEVVFLFVLQAFLKKQKGNLRKLQNKMQLRKDYLLSYDKCEVIEDTEIINFRKDVYVKLADDVYLHPVKVYLATKQRTIDAYVERYAYRDNRHDAGITIRVTPNSNIIKDIV